MPIQQQKMALEQKRLGTIDIVVIKQIYEWGFPLIWNNVGY